MKARESVSGKQFAGRNSETCHRKKLRQMFVISEHA